jgi:hypothetical protein
MWTYFPSFKNANDGEDGGSCAKYSRAREVASRSALAKIVTIEDGFLLCARDFANAGRAVAPAHPQLELIRINIRRGR